MATISSLGAGAGIDAESIISQLLTIERQPITLQTTGINKLNTKLSTWGKIQSAFSTLKDASAALTKDTLWQATTAKTSDSDALTISTGSNAATGSYKVQVNQLAKAQFTATPGYDSKSEVIGDGVLVLEIGAYTTNPDNTDEIIFTAKTDSSPVSIEIGPDDSSLEKIRDKINAASAGVTASLVTDSNGTRLVMQGATGETNAFKISVTEGTTSGLSALAYDLANNINTNQLTQSASNANVEINGLAISSASNTLNEVIEGLNIQINKATTSPVDIGVTEDTGRIQTAIETFVKAYNDAIGLIRVQTLYDDSSKTSGPLQGDTTATSLIRQLRSLAGSSTSASAVFDRLSSIGLETKTDGSLSTNSTKLNSALKNLAEMKKMFATASDSNASEEGLAVRLQKLSDQVAGSDGSINSKTTNIKSAIKRSESFISQLELRVAATEKRLRAQYTALDQTSLRLNGLSSYLAQQLSALSN